MNSSYPNVIVFGDSGEGKTAVVNMLEGDEIIDVVSPSSPAHGVLFSSVVSIKRIWGKNYNVFDTTSLNEVGYITVSASDAIPKLHDLMCKLGPSGVGLLVFVMLAPRITNAAIENYRAFFEVLCGKQVPVVIVITGLEHMDNMDKWWVANKKEFDSLGMEFSGSACIAVSRGKRFRSGEYMYQEEYDISVEKVRTLISAHSKANRGGMPASDWIRNVLVQFAFNPLTGLNLTHAELDDALDRYGRVVDRQPTEVYVEPDVPNIRNLSVTDRATRPSQTVETSAGVRRFDAEDAAESPISIVVDQVETKQVEPPDSSDSEESENARPTAKELPLPLPVVDIERPNMAIGSSALPNRNSAPPLYTQVGPKDTIPTVSKDSRKPRMDMGPSSSSNKDKAPSFDARGGEKYAVSTSTKVTRRPTMEMGPSRSNETSYLDAGDISSYPGSSFTKNASQEVILTYNQGLEEEAPKSSSPETPSWEGSGKKSKFFGVGNALKMRSFKKIRGDFSLRNTSRDHTPERSSSSLSVDKIRASTSTDSFLTSGSARSTPNVIIFGETGAGKSSVVNMLRGGAIAVSSDQASGVTFENRRHPKKIFGADFNVFDTVGLNESNQGTVPPEKAIEKLYGCMRQLAGGVNLLVFVMRAPRITTASVENFEMFFRIFCQSKVPIVLVVTRLDDLDDMDAWWPPNKHQFDKANMSFSGVACITASKGKLRRGVYTLEEEYEESKKKVEKLIYESCLPTGWSIPLDSWIVQVLSDLCNSLASYFGLEPLLSVDALCTALKKYGHLDPTEAYIKAKQLESKIRRKAATYFVEPE